MDPPRDPLQQSPESGSASCRGWHPARHTLRIELVKVKQHGN
jgi:hypothetical protein